MKKVLNFLLIINGILLIIVGAMLALMPFLQTMNTGAGNTEQSLLPILVLGLVLTAGGGFLFVKGIKKFNNK